MSTPDLIIRLPKPGERPHLVTGKPTTNPEPRVDYEDGGATVWHGDCIEVMTLLEPESFDAVVTDPPYGLDFMGKDWDRFEPREFQEWCRQWAEQALRVLKPGGHLLAFGGSRTWHRLQAGIEDAGFEIRDSIAWLYGSGFPKSLDVSKAIDKAAGAVREVISSEVAGKRLSPGSDVNKSGDWRTEDRPDYVRETTASATDEARQWEGWGTALKPAFEPIVVARKPLIGTVAANVLAYGTGALNIDATRVGDGSDSQGDRAGEESADRRYTDRGAVNIAANPGVRGGSPDGRWPTNVLLDESQAAALDKQTGTLTSGVMRAGLQRASRDGIIYGKIKGDTTSRDTYGDSGGASRFFPTFRYEAKAPTAERPSVIDENSNTVMHPTVKPVDLMRWLVRLVVPGGGRILEPFAGSGTTVEASVVEGVSCVAIELGAEHLPLIAKRIRKDHQQTLFGDLA